MLSKAQIKYIQSLQHKKYRQKSGQFIAEGAKIVPELLQAGQPVQAIYATAGWISSHEALLARTAVTVTEVDEAVLKQLSALTTPNQALALVNIPVQEQGPAALGGKVTLALETIQDPGNMGTLLRIADWFGIEQVICSPDCVDAYNPKTIQSSMGSIARVRVLEADIPALLQSGIVPAYAATLQGQSLTTFSPIKEGIVLIGNESRGLSAAVLDASTYRVTIPRLGGAESLNAAVAAGIILGRLLL